ncbi:hypothetical protein [Halocynthiibacter styelae]|uniref:Uncharacterized protein n=1 Tax=Halocynthiibacter styelae TaxID=2761955 RepID=A0A8J7J4Z0_9RHOB|nr:hypothetical protein [Paenihalocynthiibacter styelae]MBI1493425.1 hypothetical protein [Paenihalocynthiibacter styelae]
MSIKRYNSPTVHPHPLFNTDLYDQSLTLTDAECIWVQSALTQRRRNMAWGLISDYTFIFLYIVGFAGAIAFFIYIAFLIYVDQQRLLAIVGTGLFIAFLTSLAAWTIRQVIRRNRQARKIAWACLHRTSDTDDPLTGKAIVLNASYTLRPSPEPDCRMDICDDHDAENIPLQLPRHLADQMYDTDLACIPMRVLPVAGSGNVAVFAPQIRAYNTGAFWRKIHRNATHLQDAEYVLLSIGNFSMHTEMTAGLCPLNYSSSKRNGYMWMAGSGGSGLFLCIIYALVSYPELSLVKLGGSMMAFTLCLVPMTVSQIRLHHFSGKVKQFYAQQGVPFRSFLDTDKYTF